MRIDEENIKIANGKAIKEQNNYVKSVIAADSLLSHVKNFP